MTTEPLNLDEPGEWAGLWWLPSKPGEQIPGVLRYDPEGGLELSLIGAFEDRIMSSPSPSVTLVHEGSQTWDVIHGAAERREITLLDCIPTSTKQTWGARVSSPDRQMVSVASVLIGAHVSGDDEPAFCAVEVSVEDLGHWAASSVFTETMGLTDGKPDGRTSIAAKPVPTQSVEVEGTEFQLGYRYTRAYFERLRGETVGRIRNTAFVRIVPPDAISLGIARRSASQIQDLVALATHRAAGVIWLRLEILQADAGTTPDSQLIRRHADVLYSPSAIGTHNAKAVEDRRTFFTCASIPFAEIIPRWVEAYERLRPAMNMVMGLRYAPARYIENNLLTAVGAAEVLHRGLGIEAPPMPKAEFRSMREAMLALVPEEHRERIRGSVRNDQTLRDRLCALAARLDSEVVSLLMPDVDRWASRTTRARNDLAHEGRTPKHEIEELIAIVDVTTAVVILNLISELGLPAERQREILVENPQLRYAARIARERLAQPGAES